MESKHANKKILQAWWSVHRASSPRWRKRSSNVTYAISHRPLKLIVVLSMNLLHANTVTQLKAWHSYTTGHISPINKWSRCKNLPMTCLQVLIYYGYAGLKGSFGVLAAIGTNPHRQRQDTHTNTHTHTYKHTYTHTHTPRHSQKHPYSQKWHQFGCRIIYSFMHEYFSWIGWRAISYPLIMYHKLYEFIKAISDN